MPHPPEAQARSMPNAEAAEFDCYVWIDRGGALHADYADDADSLQTPRGLTARTADLLSFRAEPRSGGGEESPSSR